MKTCPNCAAPLWMTADKVNHFRCAAAVRVDGTVLKPCTNPKAGDGLSAIAEETTKLADSITLQAERVTEGRLRAFPSHGPILVVADGNGYAIETTINGIRYQTALVKQAPVRTA